MNLDVYPVASFVGEACLGNQHWVCVNPRFPSVEQREAWLARANEAIVVFLFTSDSHSPRAEFYQSGRAILRCGSGTLAAAHVLFRELKLSDISQLNTDAGPVSLRMKGEYLGYGAQGLPLAECDKAEAWQSRVNQPIISSWDLGGSHDYCLLELVDEQAVADLEVDSQALRQSSDRALIVTAAARSSTYDYVLRYFAPQHGKAEDPATGSANLQLATFWRERLGKTQLKGRQLSQAGGEFLLEVTDSCTWVMGKTKIVDSLQSTVDR